MPDNLTPAPPEARNFPNDIPPPWWRLIRSDLAVALLALLFFMAPLYRAAAFEDSFIIPKVALIQWLTVATLLVIFVWALRTASVAVTSADWRDWVGWMLALWVTLHALSALWASSGALAANQIGYLASFFALYFACSRGLISSQALRTVIGAGIVAAVVTAVWVISEDASRQHNPAGLVARLPDWRGYLAAGLGNSGHIAGLIGLFLPAAIISLLAAPRFKPVLFLAIGVMFAALVVTWSVGSTGATVISLLIWGAMAVGVVRFGLRGRLRWIRLAPVFAIGLVAVGFYLLPHPLNPHSPSLWTEAFGSERWKEGGPTRAVIYKTTMEMIRQNPVGGAGAGNFTLEYVRQIVPSVIEDPRLRLYAGSFTNDAHNEYLQMWSEAGIFALLAFLALIVAFYTRVIRLLGNPATTHEARLLLLMAGTGATVFLLDSLMTFPIRLPSHFAALMLWLAVPAVISRSVPLPNEQRRNKRDKQSPSPVAESAVSGRRFAAGTAVVLVIAAVAAGNHARRLAASFYLKMGRTAAETTTVQIGGQFVPVWAAGDYHYNQATRALAAGDEAAASQSFNIAGVLMNHSAIREAEASFRQALRWDSRYPDARSRLSALLLMRGDNEQAAAELTRTLRDLESSEIWERLGMALWRKGDREGAVKAWQVPAARRPEQAEYYRALIEQSSR